MLESQSKVEKSRIIA